ncbi:GAF domain-containing protein [Actinacidiphila sp. bgisy144]|uniref:GAF domain-containing protein n=1 Tax=Actinacidiphila sp. bgisy144 TaxID=3413791 RepID=UPI003EBA687E
MCAASSPGRPGRAADSPRAVCHSALHTGRSLASAVTTAPAPPPDGPWFPGRRRTPPPGAPFLTARGVGPLERTRALQAAVDEASRLTATPGAMIHLVDPARGGVLVLEAERGHTPAEIDACAHLTGTASVVGRALTADGLVTAVEAALPADRGRVGRATGAAAPQTLHAAPLIAPGGPPIGVLSVRHPHTAHVLTGGQRTELLELAADAAAWKSWYRRTVVLDALEHLHAGAAADRA